MVSFIDIKADKTGIKKTDRNDIITDQNWCNLIRGFLFRYKSR